MSDYVENATYSFAVYPVERYGNLPGLLNQEREVEDIAMYRPLESRSNIGIPSILSESNLSDELFGLGPVATRRFSSDRNAKSAYHPDPLLEVSTSFPDQKGSSSRDLSNTLLTAPTSTMDGFPEVNTSPSENEEESECEIDDGDNVPCATVCLPQVYLNRLERIRCSGEKRSFVRKFVSERFLKPHCHGAATKFMFPFPVRLHALNGKNTRERMKRCTRIQLEIIFRRNNAHSQAQSNLDPAFKVLVDGSWKSVYGLNAIEIRTPGEGATSHNVENEGVLVIPASEETKSKVCCTTIHFVKMECIIRCALAKKAVASS